MLIIEILNNIHKKMLKFNLKKISKKKNKSILLQIFTFSKKNIIIIDNLHYIISL